MPTRQVKAGQRRRPVTIQQKAGKVSDGMGGYTATWADVLKTRAAFREVSAFELFAQGQRQARYSCEYNIRKPGSIAIAPGMRLLDGCASCRSKTPATSTSCTRRYACAALS
jgi:head-tail adaptor